MGNGVGLAMPLDGRNENLIMIFFEPVGVEFNEGRGWTRIVRFHHKGPLRSRCFGR